VLWFLTALFCWTVEAARAATADPLIDAARREGEVI
jgi:hypothetical protein